MGYIVITGSNGGIGKATTEILLEQGYNLVLLDIDNELHEGDPQDNDMIRLPIDVSSRESVGEFVDFVLHREIEIDGLVHLAGITKDKTLLKMEYDDWKKVIDVNLTGSFLMLQEVAKLMRDTGGSIVLTGSTAAHYGNFGQANYVASKAGVEGMTKTAARELARYQIRVNCIIPGFIETQMTDQIPDDYRRQLVKQIPLQRAGRPNDVAELVAFLLSEKSSYITGASIKIDGGLKM